MSNQAAQDAYVVAIDDVMGLIEDLRQSVDNADAPSEKTNWAHVGDMNRIAAQLREILGRDA